MDKHSKNNSSEGKREHKNHIPKALKVILIFVLILVILCGVVYVVARGLINSKIGKLNYEELNLTANELGISDAENDNMSNYKNIAILGIDSRYNDYNDFARTDCIMVASVNKETNNVNLFSIYRDTLAQMDLYDKTRLDKINHAYYGGVENTLKTININYDLNVSEYVAVDFEAVAEMIDQVGGIEINVTSDELKYINSYIKGNNEVNGTNARNVTKTGLQTLNGTQALAYSRIRYTSGGDFKRTERMRTVLEKTFEKLKKKNVMELNSIMNVMLPKIKTNISEKEINELLPLALEMNLNKNFGFPYNVKDMQIDLNDHYEGTKAGKDSYDVPTSLVSDVEKLHRELFGEENYTASEDVKNIENEINKIN